MDRPYRHHKPGVKLPRGSALEWDMSTLTDDQLLYEANLSWEILYGCYVDERKVIPGMLEVVSDPSNIRGQLYYDALDCWKLRLQRAEDEMFERIMLVS